VARHNQYQRFTRFHGFLGPETLYYPTASQVCELARARLDPTRIAVIVGGNSILHGTGQRSSKLWTRQLQEALGDDYRVLNLAVRGGLPAEFGGVVAECLQGEFPRLIYITDVSPTTGVGGEPDGILYRYLYWDARYKGMLLPHPDRERYFSDRKAKEPKEAQQLDELKAGRRLDARLFYQDLWTTCVLKKAGTVWAPFLQSSFTRPRLALADLDDVQWADWLRLKEAGFREEDMALVRTSVATFGSFVVGGPLPPAAVRQGLSLRPGDSPVVQLLWLCFPPATRARSLVLVLSDNPRYVGRLAPEERADYRWSLAGMTEVIEKAGFAAKWVGDDFSEADFIDRCHLSEAGGRALARVVAPKVRELARQLGYLKEDGKR
jgi:hypothetical protein